MGYTFSFGDSSRRPTVVTTKKNTDQPTQAQVYRCNFAELPKSASTYEMFYTIDTGDIYIGQGKGNGLKLVSDDCKCSGSGSSDKDGVATRSDIEQIAAKFK